ncbi:AAA family ATPase [Streptomyces sp. NBC_00111]|uniref:McrB family protein n=1 Tax=Streptomyces sp. NBC_00111 TaxID=2975655 RepID=UPI00324FCD2F
MTDTVDRRGARLLAALDVLAAKPDGMRRLEVWAEVVARIPLVGDEADPQRNTTKGQHGFMWDSTVMTKAGWLVKRNGTWHITGVGRAVLARKPKAADVRGEAGAAYRYWDGNSKKFQVVEDFLGRLAGTDSWVAAPELAGRVGLEPDKLLRWIQGRQPDGWTRLLDLDGSIPETVGANEHERSLWQQELQRDGIQLSSFGEAERSQQLSGEDLSSLLDDRADGDEHSDSEQQRRAWLVRGSAVRGVNMVSEWLAEGYVSLSAAKLRELPSGADKERIREAVEEDYGHISYNSRNQKVQEYHAFLTRMRAGDLVLTTSGNEVHLGIIAGVPGFVASVDSRANLRRSAEWRSAGQPLDLIDDLPPGVTAKLSTQHDVVDLTEFAEDFARLAGLAPGHDPHRAQDEAEPEPPRSDHEIVLLDATKDLADRLYVDRSWLDRCVRLLRDRPQLILYGPPGTGKTYLAQALAEHLAGRENVKLVQFHPAYSYEDFFEGYRPVPGKDGHVGFALTPGPFRKLVDTARENPEQVYVLIIDEINRANLAKVFGELYFLLEYRDKAVDLMYSSGDDQAFTLPRNIFVIGTMNTADRSIALVDTAMRRRFAFLLLHPEEEPTRSVLPLWLKEKGYDGETAGLLSELNSLIADRDFAIGPSYLMRPAVHEEPDGLAWTWDTAILPLLEEYHYGEDGVDVPKRYGLDSIRARIKRARPVPRAVGGEDDAQDTGEPAVPNP